jgi:hypothetical protein
MTSASVTRLRSGWFTDPECSRETYRLQGAIRILALWGAEPTWTHSDCTRVEFGRVKHACDYRCKVEWPEWVTNDVLQAAYTASSALQTARGIYNRRAGA